MPMGCTKLRGKSQVVFFLKKKQLMVWVGGLELDGLDSDWIPKNERGLLLRGIPRIPPPKPPITLLETALVAFVRRSASHGEVWSMPKH